MIGHRPRDQVSPFAIAGQYNRGARASRRA
jgi:hypothetical protein